MSHRWVIAASFAFGVLLTMSGRGVSARTQPGGPAAVDLETLGPKVGATLPDFNLPDQHGEIRSLKSLLGPKGAVLVFFRSADW